MGIFLDSPDIFTAYMCYMISFPGRHISFSTVFLAPIMYGGDNRENGPFFEVYTQYEMGGIQFPWHVYNRWVLIEFISCFRVFITSIMYFGDNRAKWSIFWGLYSMTFHWFHWYMFFTVDGCYLNSFPTPKKVSKHFISFCHVIGENWAKWTFF